MTINKTTAAEKRESIRLTYWPDEDAWTGINEKGWFRAPRTLPLLLTILRSKALSGSIDPSQVYLELLTRHFDGGVIEMAHEGDHAYAAGYQGERAVRTWQERMNTLEKLGFIRTKKIGNQAYKYVLIVHPATVVERLRQKKLIELEWLEAYLARQIETKEDSYTVRMKRLKKSKKKAKP